MHWMPECNLGIKLMDGREREREREREGGREREKNKNNI